jgi:hypothetical protein
MSPFLQTFNNFRINSYFVRFFQTFDHKISIECLTNFDSFQILDQLNRFFNSKLSFISLRLIMNISIKIIDYSFRVKINK